MIKSAMPMREDPELLIIPSKKELFVDWLKKSFASDPWLMSVSILMLITFVGTLIGLVVDHRVITGSPAWIKPAKFAISFSIYGFTFLWLMQFVRCWKWLKTGISALSAIALTGEMGLIVLQ